MTLETDSDRAGFIGIDSISVTIAGTAATALFDHEYVEVSGIESRRPVLTVLSSAVSSAAHGDAVVVSGTSYTIVGIQPDGSGMTVLVLELAS